MNFIVRPAAAHDMAQLKPLMLEYIVDFYKRPAPPDDQLEALIRMCLAGDEGSQFVAEQDGQLVGFATLYFSYSTLRAQRVSIMNDLYVTEPVRGKGVAQSLFDACMEYTRSNGYPFMSWETAEDNFRAQRFYEKQGASRGFNYSLS